MAVPVSWVLAQTDLGLRLKAGAAGVNRECNLALTSELTDPYRWLSGGELVLTTGLRLPETAAERAEYLRGLDDRNVAGVGFATGLSHLTVPDDLLAVADELRLPLFEVPLQTPFAAIVKRVSARQAELQYDVVIRASRAQPRMTRAVVTGGTAAIVAELGRSLAAKVLVFDQADSVLAAHPRVPDAALVARARAALLSGSGSAASVSLDTTGGAVTHQRISVGRRSYGALVVISDTPLSHVDQILLGHATSLLALDFEKPARLQAAQHLLNSNALGLVLGAGADLAPAWALLRSVADSRQRIRAVVIDADTDAAVTSVRSALEVATTQAGFPLFMRTQDRQVVLVVPGTADATFARLAWAGMPNGRRKMIRAGMSGVHPLNQLTEAVANARLAGSAAERGGQALEFTALAGRALLSFDASRKILESVGDTLLTPVVDYDSLNGTELLASLRAFLEANGHWESAAAAMDVHRHTMRKRISTAQSLLDCNLDSARVRAELLLAILARQG